MDKKELNKIKRINRIWGMGLGMGMGVLLCMGFGIKISAAIVAIPYLYFLMFGDSHFIKRD